MRVASPADPVVIVGVGIVSGYGIGRDAAFEGLFAGRSAVRWLSAPPPRRPRPHSGSGATAELTAGWWPVAGAPLVPLPAPSEDARDPVTTAALQAADEAWRQSQLSGSVEPERVGCVFGTSKGGMLTAWEWAALRPGSDAPDTPWEELFPHAASTALMRAFPIRGPVSCPVLACATGLIAAVQGAQWIESGACDVALVGSADVSLQPAILAAFRRLGVLAPADEAAAATSVRPFDVARHGFQVGEGAACLVLERASHALARGARPLAEFVGGLCYSDPTNLMHPDETAESLSRLLTDLLRRHDCPPSALGYVNLHGTGTLVNDPLECLAVRRLFGGPETAPCSSLKGALGHLLGAAGSVELALTAMALESGRLPPTLNLSVPDEACRLRHVSGTDERLMRPYALKVSAGFGGHLVATLLRRWEGR